jgi:hypothetical protein
MLDKAGDHGSRWWLRQSNRGWTVRQRLNHVGCRFRDALAGATAGAATGEGPQIRAAGRLSAVADKGSSGGRKFQSGRDWRQGVLAARRESGLRCLGPMVEPGVVVASGILIAVDADAWPAAGWRQVLLLVRQRR